MTGTSSTTAGLCNDHSMLGLGHGASGPGVLAEGLGEGSGLWSAPATVWVLLLTGLGDGSGVVPCVAAVVPAGLGDGWLSPVLLLLGLDDGLTGVLLLLSWFATAGEGKAGLHCLSHDLLHSDGSN